MTKSNGHLFFKDGYEWFVYGPDVYRASVSSVIDVTAGVRCGRFDFPLWQLDGRRQHKLYPFDSDEPKAPLKLFRYGI